MKIRKKPVFSMDSEDSQTNFHENRRMKMDAVKIVNKINKEHGTIKNVYFLACGGSLSDVPWRSFARRAILSSIREKEPL